jgi:hypothetical protein
MEISKTDETCALWEVGCKWSWDREGPNMAKIWMMPSRLGDHLNKQPIDPMNNA